MCMSRFLQTAVLALCLIGAALSWAQHLLEGGAPPRKSDYVGALKRWQPLAERGDAVAQYHLGVMVEYGFGVRKNEAAALHWYHKAAEQGYAEAQHNLGLMLYIDDAAQAYPWFERAAQQGNVRALYHLAGLYEHGSGIGRDKARALELYQKAAAMGDSLAARALERIEESSDKSKP